MAQADNPPETARCVVCGRPYVGRSRPFWVADELGVIVGTAHGSCRRPGRYPALPVGRPLEEARRWAWTSARVRQRRPDPRRIEGLAELLLDHAEGPTERLTAALAADQAHLLEWWQNPQGMALTAEQAAAISARYGALIEEYRAWHAATYGEGATG